jgi:hypothetical protein
MNIVAAIPVLGRHPLLKYTIKRLLTKCGVSEVVCVGEEEDRSTCEEYGAKFTHQANYPLGAKWNRAFQEAKSLDPDAILFVGSSDWISDDWCKTLYPYLEDHYMVGKLGCHLLDIGQSYRLLYWPGYRYGSRRFDPRRNDEPIGIGRLLSREFLKKIDYKPFDDHQDNSLDWEMYLKSKDKTKIATDDVHSMAISTNLWDNKHKFNDHWNGTLKSKIVPIEFCEQHFPEYKCVK